MTSLATVVTISRCDDDDCLLRGSSAAVSMIDKDDEHEVGSLSGWISRTPYSGLAVAGDGLSADTMVLGWAGLGCGEDRSSRRTRTTAWLWRHGHDRPGRSSSPSTAASSSSGGWSTTCSTCCSSTPTRLWWWRSRSPFPRPRAKPARKCLQARRGCASSKACLRPRASRSGRSRGRICQRAGWRVQEVRERRGVRGCHRQAGSVQAVPKDDTSSNGLERCRERCQWLRR